MAEALIEVEVAYADAEQQLIIPLNLAPTSCVQEAITLSGIEDYFPDCNLLTMPVGIFGQRCGLNQLLKKGDRVEIYRPLICDPKVARRNRALLTQKKR
ncbi:MAG: RnfH family protein [Methylococcales bacterium]|nr:RnfH family protein [Methylococcales bacterium]